ncbi:hypothetical protein [Streptomyces luteoverticillatus]|nr:hypothetical protein [Streptomyces luteoverticillatus]
MANKEDIGFTLPRGATGFFQPEDGLLPKTDLRAFRAALHTAARIAGGEVGKVEERAYPRTFHTAEVVQSAGVSIVLCHAHFPWIAFAQSRGDWHEEEFLVPPSWASSFTALGFMVLGSEKLATPLSRIDTSLLTQGEWRQVRYHGVTTLGGVLFNAWD